MALGSEVGSEFLEDAPGVPNAMDEDNIHELKVGMADERRRRSVEWVSSGLLEDRKQESEDQRQETEN